MDRRQIELFFKAPKQNLKVKTFVCTNENALYILIRTALIAMLIVKFLQFKYQILLSVLCRGSGCGKLLSRRTGKFSGDPTPHFLPIGIFP